MWKFILKYDMQARISKIFQQLLLPLPPSRQSQKASASASIVKKKTLALPTKFFQDCSCFRFHSIFKNHFRFRFHPESTVSASASASKTLVMFIDWMRHFHTILTMCVYCISLFQSWESTIENTFGVVWLRPVTNPIRHSGVYLDSNRISKIESGAFKGVRTIKLDLSNNSISYIYAGMCHVWYLLFSITFRTCDASEPQYRTVLFFIIEHKRIWEPKHFLFQLDEPDEPQCFRCPSLKFWFGSAQ